MYIFIDISWTMLEKLQKPSGRVDGWTDRRTDDQRAYWFDRQWSMNFSLLNIKPKCEALSRILSATNVSFLIMSSNQVDFDFYFSESKYFGQ